MKKTFIFFVLSSISSLIFSQDLILKLEDGHKKGKIIEKDGTEKFGILALAGSLSDDPWNIQHTVYFLTEEKYKELSLKGRVKTSKMEEYTPSKIKGFYYENTHYESLKYSDVSSLSLSMIPKSYFMEKIKEGKMSVYKFYVHPGDFSFTTNEQQALERKAFLEECRTKPQIVVKKGDDKAKNIQDTGIEKVISDCEVVLKKYHSAQYGLDPKNTEGKKGVSKLLNKLADYENRSSAILIIADDYNKECNN